MKLDKIRIIAISDVHLGNKRTKTNHILTSLREFFKNLNDKESIDILFIAGDFFDRLLDFSSEEAIDIIIFIDWLDEYCNKYNIRLRVLEGTHSHDWNQNKWFSNTLLLKRSGVDFKYFNTLAIEYMDDLDLNILYIPDEWNSNNDITYNQALELLKSKNLSQVDMTIMHGQFEFQLPIHLKKIPKHNSEKYIPLAKYYTIVGHVHEHKPFENILPPGSFDRLAFNEEYDKGGLDITIYKNGNKEFKFIKNNNAKIYKTIDIKENNIEKIYKIINKEISKIPLDSYVRLRLNKSNPLLANFNELKNRYTSIHWSHILDDDELPSQTLFLDSSFTKYKSIEINNNNLLELVSNEIDNRNLDNKEKMIELLKGILEKN